MGLTHHPVGPLASGHVAHPEQHQVLDPQATGVAGQVQEVEVKGEVALFDQQAAVVHHGLVHLLMIIGLRHHEPEGTRFPFLIDKLKSIWGNLRMNPIKLKSNKFHPDFTPYGDMVSTVL